MCSRVASFQVSSRVIVVRDGSDVCIPLAHLFLPLPIFVEGSILSIIIDTFSCCPPDFIAILVQPQYNENGNDGHYSDGRRGHVDNAAGIAHNAVDDS